MSVQEVPYYYVVCDCCGERADYGDYSAWSDPGDAVSYADPEFQEVDGQNLCDACWCWPEDLPDYPGDEAWTGGDDPVRKHATHPTPDQSDGRLAPAVDPEHHAERYSPDVIADQSIGGRDE